jgi:predicted ester cyclase
MTSTEKTRNVELYERFLAALNDGDIDTLATVIDPLFTDHHPGFDIDGIDSYLDAVRGVKAALALTGELDEVLTAGDRVITRVTLTGTHVGDFMGVAPTGRPVTWTTTEVWRVAGGRLVERWAQDDLLGLRDQLFAEHDNLRVVRAVSEAVIERRLDDLDRLFGADFVDHNAAWEVTDLATLKDIIRAAYDGLDFVPHVDELYPAGPDKVVMIITFRGRHIGRFFGQEPTGRDVTWTSTEVYRVADGAVVERWTQADTAGLMGQLGVELPGA